MGTICSYCNQHSRLHAAPLLLHTAPPTCVCVWPEEARYICESGETVQNKLSVWLRLRRKRNLEQVWVSRKRKNRARLCTRISRSTSRLGCQVRVDQWIHSFQVNLGMLLDNTNSLARSLAVSLRITHFLRYPAVTTTHNALGQAVYGQSDWAML